MEISGIVGVLCGLAGCIPVLGAPGLLSGLVRLSCAVVLQVIANWSRGLAHILLQRKGHFVRLGALCLCGGCCVGERQDREGLPAGKMAASGKCIAPSVPGQEKPTCGENSRVAQWVRCPFAAAVVSGGYGTGKTLQFATPCLPVS